ncbi:MAG TPA: hypothetical protein VMX13_02490 [Sedimentisphaerales bacterium]|nr:hypothetical protein [Sedimentisphaerales bacterium]
MNGKVTFVVSVVLACAVIGTAAEVEWTGKGADDLWSTGGNWEGGKAPVASDAIVLCSPPERGPVIDSDVICGEIRGPAWRGDRQTVDVLAGANVKIGGWWRFAESGACVGTINVLGGNVTIDGVLRCSNGSRAHGIVNVVDGVVRADGMWLSDTGGGEMNVSGNSLVEFVNNLSFGGNRGEKPMTINMNGGMIRVGRELRCPHNSARAGMAAINLAGGIIDCASFSHADVAYSMDITEGEFRIKGDVTAEMKEDIGSGYIKAFGGKGSVLCKYDAARDRTIVMAADRKSAWNPQPGNRAEQVRPDAMLKWNPGKDAQTYNIYLGTSLAAVASGAKAYRDGEKVAEIQPGLKFNQTYYWRVDTVDKAGAVAGGTVWQLTTTDGKTAAPSPQDGATAVGVDATLGWRPGLVAASHNVYLGTDYDGAKNATQPAVGKLSEKGFTPERLELGRKYYWRVDAVNSKWSESPWKGDIWSFTVDEGKAQDPRPVNEGLWAPTKVTLSWNGARTAVSHNVYFGENTKGLKLVSSGQKETTYAAGPLKEATTYFWQVEEVHRRGEKVKGDIWQFSTEGMLDLKVDLAVPQWDDRSKYREGTAKEGWFIWASSRWADMYMHDAGWLPEGNGNDADGILGSGIQLYLDNGKGGNGTVMAKGLCRGSLAGDMPPYGEPEGDPIANTYFYSCDWAGQKNGDCFLLIRGLPAGEYEMTSYHNHWEPCTQQTRNCHLCESGMPPMPSVTANPLPAEPLPGYGGWVLPKGTGKGVVSLQSAKDVKVSSVLKDEDVTKSYIRFATDGSDVLVIYEAADNTYPDRARSGREGSRGILNAFELKLVSWDKKSR